MQTVTYFLTMLAACLLVVVCAAGIGWLPVMFLQWMEIRALPYGMPLLVLFWAVLFAGVMTFARSTPTE